MLRTMAQALHTIENKEKGIKFEFEEENTVKHNLTVKQKKDFINLLGRGTQNINTYSSKILKTFKGFNSYGNGFNYNLDYRQVQSTNVNFEHFYYIYNNHRTVTTDILIKNFKEFEYFKEKNLNYFESNILTIQNKLTKEDLNYLMSIFTFLKSIFLFDEDTELNALKVFMKNKPNDNFIINYIEINKYNINSLLNQITLYDGISLMLVNDQIKNYGSNDKLYGNTNEEIRRIIHLITNHSILKDADKKLFKTEEDLDKFYYIYYYIKYNTKYSYIYNVFDLESLSKLIGIKSIEELNKYFILIYNYIDNFKYIIIDLPNSKLNKGDIEIYNI